MRSFSPSMKSPAPSRAKDPSGPLSAVGRSRASCVAVRAGFSTARTELLSGTAMAVRPALTVERTSRRRALTSAASCRPRISAMVTRSSANPPRSRNGIWPTTSAGTSLFSKIAIAASSEGERCCSPLRPCPWDYCSRTPSCRSVLPSILCPQINRYRRMHRTTNAAAAATSVAVVRGMSSRTTNTIGAAAAKPPKSKATT